MQNPSGVHEFMGMKSKDPLTVDSLNRLLIKEVVELRWKLESYQDGSDDEDIQSLNEQLHEAQIQVKVAEKQKEAAEESAAKWMNKYVEELEEKRIAELILNEEKNGFEENLRVILTNSREMEMLAEVEINDLRTRLIEENQVVKQLQEEAREYEKQLQEVVEECNGMFTELKSGKGEVVPEEMQDSTDPGEVAFEASIDKSIVEQVKDIVKKNREQEAELACARERILQLESLPVAEPDAISKRSEGNEVYSEQEKEDSSCSKMDTDLLPQTTDVSVSSRTSKDQNMEDDMQAGKGNDTHRSSNAPSTNAIDDLPELMLFEWCGGMNPKARKKNTSHQGSDSGQHSVEHSPAKDDTSTAEQKSQIVRQMGQITMLQNDKENLHKELDHMKEQIGSLKSEVDRLQDAESEKIKAIGMADLMKREKSKKEDELEALQSTVDFMREEVEDSKLRNRATVQKLVRVEKDKEDLELEIIELQEQLADIQQSQLASMPPPQQVDEATQLSSCVEDKAVQACEPIELSAQAGFADGNQDDSRAITSAQTLDSTISLLQSELLEERRLISENYQHVLDACQSTQEEELEAPGLENLAQLRSRTDESHAEDESGKLNAVAEPQEAQELEEKVIRGSAVRLSRADSTREAGPEELQNQDLLLELEELRASNAKLLEREKSSLARLEELTIETSHLRNECMRLSNEKDEQNNEWIKNISSIEASHRQNMSEAINSVQAELEDARLALKTAELERKNMKEERVKAAMLMSQTCSEKDELEAALGVRGMAEKNLKEESEDYTEVLKTDLNTTNRVLAEVREENTDLREQVANLEQARKASSELHENLNKELEGLRETNKELEKQILAKSNLPVDKQSPEDSNLLLPEDISNKTLDDVTVKEYLESFRMREKAKTKMLEEQLKKKDRDHEVTVKSLITQDEATTVLYDEDIHQLMQENNQLIEENSQLKEKNRTLRQMAKDAHLHTQVDSLEGNLDSMRRRIGSMNSSLASTFLDLLNAVKSSQLDPNEAWRLLESAHTRHEKDVSPNSQVVSQDVDHVDEWALNLRVQSGWYEPNPDLQMRAETPQDRPHSRCTSEGSACPRSEGVRTPSSAISATRKSPLKSDPGSSGSKSTGKSSAKKSTKKPSKPAGKFWKF